MAPSDRPEPPTDADAAPAEAIRVVIAEDQQLIRRAFATMFQMEPDIEVVGQAADGVEAIDLVRRYRPDIVLMDIQMPRLGGIAATRRIVAEHPGSQVVALSTFDTDDLVFEAISAGAQAYLLKDTSENEILDTIRAVKRGESRLSPLVARKVFEEFRRARPQVPVAGEGEAADEPLTEREEEILALVAKGRSNREIADAVHLAEGTVKNYVSRIMEKLHVQTRTELAVKALGRPRR
ncbi:response regulator transcription factor [Pinisolibacter sp.]|uniref:response regulator transcription factor n=1 Tax=Pinisolibacter sp. TaxID=2172024 RepID=UPI002FDDB47A